MAENQKPLLVGITGSFGTGKSRVAGIFKKLGARVLNADEIAHEVFRKTNPVYRKMRSLFPELKGNLTRKRIAQVVFGDSKKRKRLEKLIHPYVFNRIWEEIDKTNKPVVVLEIPLLFEGGFQDKLDQVITVKSKTPVALRRLAQKGYSREEVEARWKAQIPLLRKIRLADYVIDNSNGINETKKQVRQIWNELGHYELVSNNLERRL